MSKATLLELADRVEKASGPDRELDVSIGSTVFDVEWRPYRPNARKTWGFQRAAKDDVVFYGTESVPRYTASLDAAMTLVPSNIGFQLTVYSDVKPGCTVGLHGDLERAATPALALTAAALRARTQQESSDADK